MSNPTPREPFEVVRRGYDPAQVDRRLTALATELATHRSRADEAERRIQELHTAPVEEPAAPSFAGLGARIEKMLGLADEEAQHVRATAAEDALSHRALTEQDADKLRQDAERYAKERRTDVDTEAAGVIQEAKRAADTLRDESERDAKARREEAEALFEGNRAKAAQAAADFETTLAHRRDQSERDYTEKMKNNEQQLGLVAQRAEQLRLEAEKLRADSDRKSKRTLDEANRRAEEIVAQAKATAERIRTESERELAASTQRRDSINSQLTNVRQMLATLTGASLPDALWVDPADDQTDQAGTPSPELAVESGAPGSPTSHVVTQDASGTATAVQEEVPSEGDASAAAPGSPVQRAHGAAEHEESQESQESQGSEESEGSVSLEKPAAAQR